MLFNSYYFIIVFLPIALVGFYCLGRLGRGPGAIWLVLTSFCFYAFWNPPYVMLLLASVLFNYGVSVLLQRYKDRPVRQRVWLSIGIVTDLTILIYYKYLAALISVAVDIGFTHLQTPSILLPLGISFFTFTQIAYLIDVQQDVVEDRTLLNYMLFVTFFPHLIAGPILHNREIMPQFAQRSVYRFSLENLTIGAVLFIAGLAKKCLLADPIAAQVDTGFSHVGHLAAPSAWFLMMTYAVQLYFDFSGYTDMAIGIARMFNIRFPANFNSPYKASSIIDFWQRWHMTLTRLLTLYLFNPMVLTVARYRTAHGLPIDRKAQTRPGAFLTMLALPLFITMGIAGIWHGAGVKFAIFGLLHATYLTINHAWRAVRPTIKVVPGALESFVYWLLTLSAVLVALVFFRAPTMADALKLIRDMAGAQGLGQTLTLASVFGQSGPLAMIFAQHGPAASITSLKTVEAAVQNGQVVMLWLIVLFMPNSQQIMCRYEPVLGRIKSSSWTRLVWRPNAVWAAATGVVGAFAVMAIAGTTDFVYFQF
jgi:alginate O-acetyltransferase complex protein AlgI